MEIMSVDYSRKVCVKYVENIRRIRLNGRKDYFGKLKILLQFSSSIPSYDQNLTMQDYNQFLSLIPQRNLFQLNSARESGPSNCLKLLALLSFALWCTRTIQDNKEVGRCFEIGLSIPVYRS